MIWSVIRGLFLDGLGDHPEAGRDSFYYLSMAMRDICSRLDLPELYQPDARVDTVAGQDYIELDCDLDSVLTVVDLSTQRKLYPEPEGWRSREQFLDETGKPPEGDPRFWVRQGKRIWFRDTPDSVREIKLAYRFYPGTITENEMHIHPITPPQYDESIYLLAQSKWFANHPGARDGQPHSQLALGLEELAMRRLEQPKSSIVEEGRDRKNWVRAPGYSFDVRGRC